MARKSDKLTPRQRQSRQIMREKAAKKRRKVILHKLWITVGVLGCLSVVGGSVWVWKTGLVGKITRSVVDGAYGLTAQAGFSLESLYLEGRSRTPMEDIQNALIAKKGDPILHVALEELRVRLEQIPTVRLAAVERALPDTLYIRIVEREPVALWQYGGKVSLVDDNGVVMHDIDSAPYKHLPLIVGEQAPQHVAELLGVLALEPELAKRYEAAVHVGARRWNIKLKGDIEVKLPENNSAQAWQKLAELDRTQQLLDRDVKVIDLRVEGRLFITVSPEHMPNKALHARET